MGSGTFHLKIFHIAHRRHKKYLKLEFQYIRSFHIMYLKAGVYQLHVFVTMASLSLRQSAVDILFHKQRSNFDCLLDEFQKRKARIAACDRPRMKQV
jgi:hypothetical protein